MIDQLVVSGLGLIGGSVVLAARERGLARKIVGVDQPAVLGSSKAQQALHECVELGDRNAYRDAVASADMCVLAGPVSAIISDLPQLLDVAPGVVTDCGSTKRAICEAVASHPRRDRFVAGHPMAGKARGGFENAAADLFENRYWLLCPAGSESGAVQTLERFVRDLGARPTPLPAREHDCAVALTSHVPQLLASALRARSSMTSKPAEGPGFASATRVAGGNPDIWRDIFATNADLVARELSVLTEELRHVTEALERNDVSVALELLRRARER